MTGLIVFLLICCFGTILLESLPILFLSDKKLWQKANLVCNVVTNPVLNVIMLLLFYWIEDLQILTVILWVLEVAVVFLEAYFYQRMLNKRFMPCFGFSLISNALSFAVGLALSPILLVSF